MIRLLSKRDLSQAAVEIHPIAKPAFQFFHTLNHQLDPSDVQLLLLAAFSQLVQ